MSQIWKFPLWERQDRQVACPVIDMPKYHTVLSVQVQNGIPCVWALIPGEPAAPVPVRFRIVCTGESFDKEGLHYLGTVQLDAGALVLHVFQEKKK